MICQFTGNACSVIDCPLWCKVYENCLIRFVLLKYLGLEVDEKIHFQLSKREREILGYITQGYSNKEIANIICISHQTVKNYVSQLMRKLGAKNRTDLAVINTKSASYDNLER